MNAKVNTILQCLKSPWTGGVGLLLSILSITFAIYTHQSSQKEKSLYVSVGKRVISIINTKNMGDNKFSVIDGNGEKINGDVSAIKIHIVNNGDLPIWKRQILTENLTINLKENSGEGLTIIGSFVESSKREKIIKPFIEAKNSQVNISFNILESKDYISLTIIFLGSTPPKYSIKGAIEGISSIQNGRNKSNEKTLSPAHWLFLILMFLIIVNHLSKNRKISSFLNKENAPENKKYFTLSSHLELTIVSLMLVFLLYLSYYIIKHNNYPEFIKEVHKYLFT